MSLNIYTLFLTKPDNEILENIIIHFPDQIKNKILKYQFLTDKWRACLSELLIRKILSEELNVNSNALKICSDENLKPYLNNFLRQFNLSHSNNLIVLATDETPIGIDIEYVKPLEGLEDILSYFSQKEQKAFFSKNKNQRLDFFYTLWTLKESYIKAIGKGLNSPLDSFTIDVSEKNISLISSVNSNAQWSFKRYQISDNYKCAVCAQHTQFPESLTIVKASDLLQLFL